MAGTVVGKSSESIQAYLDRLKKVKIGSGMLDLAGNPVKQSWEDYVPAQLSYQKPDDSDLLNQVQNEIGARDEQLTQAAVGAANNRKNQELYRQQQALLRAARKNSVKKLTPAQVAAQAGANPLSSSFTNATGSIKGGPGSTSNTSVSSPTPGGLTTIMSHGKRVTVNSAVAGRFKGFLDALWKTGYHFSSVGGYSNRNIAGTSTRSAHSYGYAIDIDPSRNPIYYNSKGGVYALPKNVGALAAKYGLHWGGNWHTRKDYMHFSVPTHGVE